MPDWEGLLASGLGVVAAMALWRHLEPSEKTSVACRSEAKERHKCCQGRVYWAYREIMVIRVNCGLIQQSAVRISNDCLIVLILRQLPASV